MKKKILDVMIDFETFGRQPESVPINLAVVAWNRYAEENPFVIPGVVGGNGERISEHDLPVFSSLPIPVVFSNNSRFAIWHFDVCACLVCGMTVEPETQSWWMERPACSRDSLFLKGRNQMPPYDVLASFIRWLSDLKSETESDEICIWAQGSDFDIAKLRWLFHNFQMSIRNAENANMLLHHTLFRDARTVILEMGNKLFDGKRGFSVDVNTGIMITDGKPNKEDELSDFNNIYDRIPSLQYWAKQMEKKDGTITGDDGFMSNYLLELALGDYAHNSIYDCMRSIYNVWWLNKALDTQMI